MTSLQRDMDPEEIRALGWVDETGRVNDAFKTVAQGAATATWCATAPELDGQGGVYCEDCHVGEEVDGAPGQMARAGVLPHARDAEIAAALWTRSEDMVGERFPA